MRSSSRMALACLALLTVATGCKPLDDAMVAIFGRSMRDSRSFDPYENPVGAPEGSVAFASGNSAAAVDEVNFGQPEGYDEPYFTQANMVPIGTGDAVVQSLENPFAYDDPAALERGQEIYLRQCVVCHGPAGVGTGAYILATYPALAAFNLSGAQVAGYTDEYIYGMIRVGRGLMPAWGHQIRPIDRWAAVVYVRQLQAEAGTFAVGGGE